MAEDTKIDEKQRVRSFFNRLVIQNYQIDKNSPFQAVYDSDEKYSHINDLKDTKKKLICLVRLLVKELRRFGRMVSHSKIIKDLQMDDEKRKVLVYQVLFYDEKDMNFYDYFFILDTKALRLFCFRRLKSLSSDSRHLFKVITYLHGQLYKDVEEIHKILNLKGLSNSCQQIAHLIDESNVN